MIKDDSNIEPILCQDHFRREVLRVKEPNAEKVKMNLWALQKALYPISRSIMGDEIEATLDIIEKIIPIQRLYTSSGEAVGSWVIPKRWTVNKAFIKKLDGSLVVDYDDNPMHLWQYSTPTNSTVSRESLFKVLAAKPEAPHAIPHIVTYYKKRWGFSVTEEQKKRMTDEYYQVCVDTEFQEGALTIGELTIPGKTDQVVIIDAVISCPSLANNITGAVVAVYLAQQLLSGDQPYFTYRFLFTPETIGPLVMGKEMSQMQESIIGGCTLVNLGDENSFNYKVSRRGDTLVDRAIRHALRWSGEPHVINPFDVRTGTCGNEKAYNSLGLEIPIGAITRSPLGTYPEYDTSLDDLDLISKDNMLKSFQIINSAIEALERSQIYKHKFIGEPFLTGYGLFPKIEKEEDRLPYDYLMGFTTGEHTLVDIANLADLPVNKFDDAVKQMLAAGLIEPL